jgi:hypothetical protein
LEIHFSRKPLSKFSCVYLPLKILINIKHFLINKKYFPVNRNTFWSTENTFLSTETPFGCICFSKSDFQETTFQTFLCLFAIRKVGQQKTLFSQRKIWLGFQESVFLKNLGRKHFLEVVKNLEMSLFDDYIKFNPQTFDWYI